MQRKPFPKFIIISGSGKKVGKTFMATALIRAFSCKAPLVALKISPHNHDSFGEAMVRSVSEGIRIFQDMVPHRKNSGQFLEAGAQQSFFIETDDLHLPEAFNLFMKECNPWNHPVICESGALGSLLKPGFLIFITHPLEFLSEGKQATLDQADLVLQAKSFIPEDIVRRFSLTDNGWHYNEFD